MRKLFALVAVCLAGGLTATACNSPFDPVAATVDGVSISQSQLKSTLDQLASDGGFVCAFTAGAPTVIRGTGSGTYGYSFATGFVLQTMVLERVFGDMISHLHLHMPARAVASQRASLLQAVQPSQLCSTPAKDTVAGMGTFANTFATYQAEIAFLQSKVPSNVFNSTVESLDVYVNPAYGKWDPLKGIVANCAPAARFELNTGALSGPMVSSGGAPGATPAPPPTLATCPSPLG